MRKRAGLSPKDDICTIDGVRWVVGFDEVGVGCLAGPVVAAAFAYPFPEWSDLSPPVVIRDSKTLSKKQRLESGSWLNALPSAIIAVVESSVEEIDTLNILRASQLAMMRCFEQVRSRLSELPSESDASPIRLLIDGNRLPPGFKHLESPWLPETIVKGDAKSFAIAAASIIAKNHRDGLMEDLAKQHPEYGWESNVGYGTPQHRLALKQKGPTSWHRRSFDWGLSDEVAAEL